MSNILNDGYHVPTDQELLKKLIDNSNFNYEEWAAERYKNFLTREQSNDYRKIIEDCCKLLKTEPDLLVSKVNRLVEEINQIKDEIKQST